MSVVIRTHLSETTESVTLGVRPRAAPTGIATPPRNLIADSMGMSAMAIGAVAPDLVAVSTEVDESELQGIAEIRERAYEQGLRLGREDAMLAVESDWQEKLKRLADIVEALHAEREVILSTLEDDVVALTFEAIVRILGDRPVTRLIVERAVRDLYASGDYQNPITVRVSSEDYELLVAEPAVIELEDQRAAIRLVEDTRLKLGGCIVETPRGALDARIETQFERLRSALLDAHASKRNDLNR